MSVSNGETVNASSIGGSQHSAVRLGSVIYLSIVGTLGLIANGLVIVAFWRYRKLRTATKNLFILNLAVCDIVLSILDVIFSISSSVRGKWLYGSAGCYFYGFSHYFFISNTVSTLAVISVDRFYYITKPGRAHTSIITKFRAGVLIVIVYAYTFVFTVPPVMGWNSFVEEKHFFSGCYIDYSDQNAASISYSLTASVFLFLVPLAVMLYCYVKIFLAVRRSTRKNMKSKSSAIGVNGNTVRKKFPLMKRTHIQTAKMIIMAVFFSMIVWVPYVLVSLVKAFSSGTYSCSVASHITVLIAKSCVIYNVLIYVVLNRKFKAAILDMICCGKRPKGIFLDRYVLGGSARQRLSRILSDTDREHPSQTVEGQRSRLTALNNPHQRWSVSDGLTLGKETYSSIELSKSQQGGHMQRPVEFNKEISFQDLTVKDSDPRLRLNTFGLARKREEEHSTLQNVKSNSKGLPKTSEKLDKYAVVTVDGVETSIKEKDSIKAEKACRNVFATGVNGRVCSKNEVSTLSEVKRTALDKIRALTRRKLPDTPQNVNLPTTTVQENIEVSDNNDKANANEGHRLNTDNKCEHELIGSTSAETETSAVANETPSAHQNSGMLGAYKIIRTASQRKFEGPNPLRHQRHLNFKRGITRSRESIKSLYSRRENVISHNGVENRCTTLTRNFRGLTANNSIQKRYSNTRRGDSHKYGSKITKNSKHGTKTISNSRSHSKFRKTSVNSLEISSPSELENIHNYWKRMSLCLDDIDLNDGIAVIV